MVQEAPNITADAGHGRPSPPSRLLSKHRPRRHAAVPPAAPTPGQLDLNLCHCCGVRFAPPQPGAKRQPVRHLPSHWRVVLLCAECLALVRSAAVCSYCLSLDNLPPEDSSAVTCRRCSRCVHPYCIPGEHRTALIQPIDVENYVCVDCCPTVKPGGSENGVSSASVHMLQRERRKGDIVAGTKLGASKEVLAPAAGDSPLQRTVGGNPDLPDEDLALQLHLAMNGSQRILRAGNTSGGDSDGQSKGHKSMVGRKKVNGDQQLCVTNMMDQLDDDEAGEEPLCWIGRPARRRLDPSVTIVLALECVDSKHVKENMRGKRKGSLGTKEQNDLVDRYKRKYSKRNSNKQKKNENPEFKNIPGGKDKYGDGGNNDIALMK